jgi:hypothetical protein
MTPYTPSNWYWIVAGSTAQVYSSAGATYVPTADTTYQAWIAAGNIASRISSEQDLWEVLATQYPAGLPANATGTAAFQLDATTKELLDRLLIATPSQIDTWLDANTGNVTEVRSVLKKIVRVMALVVRRAVG